MGIKPVTHNAYRLHGQRTMLSGPPFQLYLTSVPHESGGEVMVTDKTRVCVPSVRLSLQREEREPSTP